MARRNELKVFFPWERRKGLFGLLGRARVKIVALAIGAVVLVVWIHAREEKAAAVRATRATMDGAYRAVESYRADNAGQCPRELGDLVVRGYAREVPVDAWGRPLRLVCPGRRDAQSFEISSDGPDGIPGGLDRVE
ncbi:MAG TPA: type II secretion system protein GspG [Labilithrix sp.]|jgi:general secretion pathway protein G